MYLLITPLEKIDILKGILTMGGKHKTKHKT